MKSKNILIGAIAVIVLILIGGGIWAYFGFTEKGSVDKVESESKDGFAKLKAIFYDFSGTPTAGMGLMPQALIGGTSKQTHVAFIISATNTGNVKLTEVTTTSPNANMDGAFNNIVPLSSLAIGASNILIGSTSQSCTNVGGTVCDGLSSGGCNANEECCPGNICAIQLDQYASGTIQHNVDFSVSLTGKFLNALGQQQSVTSETVTLTYDIRAETCTDGTTINTCVFARTGADVDKPKYCNFVEGTAPSIINKASVCGCPIGMTPSGENCVPLTCTFETETWNVNTCSQTVTSEAGVYGTHLFCKLDQTTEARCNQCLCTLDAQGNPKTGCSLTTDPSTCVYQSYTGGLSGTISEE